MSSRLEATRVLHVPNEYGNFTQVGIRRPLRNLLDAGLVDDVAAYSMQRKQQEGEDPEDVRQGLIAAAKAFEPSHVFMQHVGSTGLRDRHFESLRKTCPNAVIIYHEADPYSRWKHPLPRAAAAAGRASDITFTVGKGTFRSNFVRSGARDVRWSSHVFDPDRFPRKDVSESDKRFDVVLLANRNLPRMRGLPNWRDRIRFVELLSARFGARLGLFGRGWELPGAQGVVPFDQQADAIRSGWVSANWDHFADEPWYYSNRLPISMASGSIHATTWHPGYEEIFGSERQYLTFGTKPESLIHRIEQILDATSVGDRISMGHEAMDYAWADWRQDDQLVWMLNSKRRVISPDAASECWDLNMSDIEDL